jgi:two-component system invasion response regulator UvrY
LINLLVVDPHVLVRKGIRALLDGETEFVVTAECTSYAEAVDAIRRHPVDVVIADTSMAGPIAGQDSLDLIAQLRRERPRARIIVLTMRGENAYAIRALNAGAHGFVTKDLTPDQLVTAIHRVMSGATYLSPSVAESLALKVVRQSAEPQPSERLSRRESTVFSLLASGKSTSEIASHLALSTKTVSAHKIKVLRKMNFRSVADLVRYAVEHEVITH